MSSFDFDVVTGPSAARATAGLAREPAAPAPAPAEAERAEPPPDPAGRRVDAAE